MWVYLYVSMYMCVQMPIESLEGICSYGAGIIGDCEPPEVAGTKSSSL